MNVRCKSTTAVMYTAKYESGSKGKCIQLGDEWLTPNEFEDRAGSKAKKYLSSIKCLGRPLRVFVNSGELKGTGPPPAPKVTKKVKPSAVQPIAPAPPPGSGMLTTAGPQIGQITAPPTPSHISSAPPIPANMIMGGQQPPILINQTFMASTMLGNIIEEDKELLKIQNDEKLENLRQDLKKDILEEVKGLYEKEIIFLKKEVKDLKEKLHAQTTANKTNDKLNFVHNTVVNPSEFEHFMDTEITIKEEPIE